MSVISAFPTEKKISVIFRMEPGSLGPEGEKYVQEFCDFAQTQLQACAKHYLIWLIVPRFDKTLTEMEFQLAGKVLNEKQATKYLNLFGEQLTHFEEQLEDNLEAIINQFFGR